MHPVKSFLIGVGVGLLIAGDIMLTWNVQKTLREYCTPTREMKMPDIYYSTDEEMYNHDCINDAIDDFEIGEIATIYQGEAVRKSASDFLYFDSDNLKENAIDNVGEYADSWLSISKEEEFDLQAMLKAAVDAWADKHSQQPTFYGVKNIKEIKVKVLADGEYELQGNKK